MVNSGTLLRRGQGNLANNFCDLLSRPDNLSHGLSGIAHLDRTRFDLFDTGTDQIPDLAGRLC